MAVLQHTYGDPATSYNITALHIVDSGMADHIFLQGAGNFIKDNITALHIMDTGIADSIFLKGGVSSQFAEAGAPADPESWE